MRCWPFSRLDTFPTSLPSHFLKVELPSRRPASSSFSLIPKQQVSQSASQRVGKSANRVLRGAGLSRTKRHDTFRTSPPSHFLKVELPNRRPASSSFSLIPKRQVSQSIPMRCWPFFSNETARYFSNLTFISLSDKLNRRLADSLTC
jgi:hypothetical protein